MKLVVRIGILLPVLVAGVAAQAANVAFTAKPVVKKDGASYRISFTAATNTDVAVYIENAKGEVIRHLAAGMLGTNAPAPLQSGSLTQSLLWDGKANYGQPAGEGPFRVRVGLGLGAKYDKVVSGNKVAGINPFAFAVGPDGTLYVYSSPQGAVWGGRMIVALNRDGTYQRTVWPFPTSLSKEQVKGITSFELNGRPAPLITMLSMGLYGNFGVAPASRMAVTPDGRKLYMLSTSPVGIGVLGTDGSCPDDKLGTAIDVGEPVKSFEGFSDLVLSGDGKYGYFSGLKTVKGVQPVVYRFALADVAKCTPFFGEPGKPDKDNAHLGAVARGLAVDGKGHLFISDTKNDRVLIVNESDGRFVAAFPAKQPAFLSVSPKTGAAYVYSQGSNKILKFKPDAAGVFAEAGAVAPYMERPDTCSVTVDITTEPAVVWTGDRVGAMSRIEDTGEKFGTVQTIEKSVFNSIAAESYMAVCVDRKRNEVYARNSSGGGMYMRYSEAADKVEEFRVPGDACGGGKGFLIMPHADGNLYGLRWPYCLLRWDRTGKPIAWEKPVRPSEQDMLFNSSKTTGDYPLKLPDSISFVPVSMTELPHTMGIRDSDGHIFVFTFTVRGRVPKCLNEYLPTGEKVNQDPIIWMTTDAVVGPRFDAAGNIYCAEVIKPRGWLPPEIRDQMAKMPPKEAAELAAFVRGMYGSIVKFTPKGGTFDFGEGRTLGNPWDGKLGKRNNPFEGEMKLDPSLKVIDESEGGKSNRVIGAEWIHPGVGHVGLYACNCENISFDVDPFGRVFFPDPQLYRLRVIDTAGNAIASFGSYGNAESQGPDSPVVDPKSGKLRPRLPDDPRTLRSPFAEPEIAFSWIVGVGVTDKYIYTGDSIARRMLKLKLTYAAEESCEVK
jgi:hypothetical protein